MQSSRGDLGGAETGIFLQRGLDRKINGRTDLPVGHEAKRTLNQGALSKLRHTPRKRRIHYAAAFRFITGVSGILDHRWSLSSGGALRRPGGVAAMTVGSEVCSYSMNCIDSIFKQPRLDRRATADGASGSRSDVPATVALRQRERVPSNSISAVAASLSYR